MKLTYNNLGGREKGWGYTHNFNVPLANTYKKNYKYCIKCINSYGLWYLL